MSLLASRPILQHNGLEFTLVRRGTIKRVPARHMAAATRCTVSGSWTAGWCYPAPDTPLVSLSMPHDKQYEHPAKPSSE